MVEFNEVLQAMSNALSVIKGAKDLLPSGPERDAADAAIGQAEQAVRLAEAQAARQLGYPICRCTFPPQIMLMKEPDRYSCPGCGRIHDPTPTIVETGSSCIDARG